MLNWLRQFNIFCFMDNADHSSSFHEYECLAGVESASSVSYNPLFESIDHFLSTAKWKFGHLSYELKNQFYPLASKKDLIGFPDHFFFIPKHVLYIKQGMLTIESENPLLVWEQIRNTSTDFFNEIQPVTLSSRLTKDRYIERINQLKEHIHRGDCYEINFCQEFYANEVFVDPFLLFHQLIAISPNPFSVFYRVEDRFLLCASPERFLKKEGNRLISQPIKGTIKRQPFNRALDDHLKESLLNSQKDQAENVMVVDLVRNDLSRICEKNSVEVTELFGIYSFPQVHQMISTISGQLKQGKKFSDIIKALFPMGSMTGAPKYKVLQLIDSYEESARGIFSGSVGYIKPDGDFDFNVVIRSLMYDEHTRYLSAMFGSGITFYSDAEQEWEECLLKAEAIQKLLGRTINVN